MAANGVQNSANKFKVVLVVWAGAESAEKTYFPSGYIHPLGPEEHMQSQTPYVDIDVDTFSGGNRASGA
jgi:hypothetical protein